tara:strand:- start:3313 stop:3678 length:366 start_codon:yes stop_codon:yes gene_type:complete
MGSICIDTDILIEFVKGKKGLDEQIGEFDDVYITSLSIFEYGKGRETMGQVEKLKDFNILELDSSHLFKAVEIFKDLIKKGDLIGDNDIIIGAICIAYDIPLLTLNKKHFGRLKKFGLRLI